MIRICDDNKHKEYKKENRNRLDLIKLKITRTFTSNSFRITKESFERSFWWTQALTHYALLQLILNV